MPKLNIRTLIWTFLFILTLSACGGPDEPIDASTGAEPTADSLGPLSESGSFGGGSAGGEQSNTEGYDLTADYQASQVELSWNSGDMTDVAAFILRRALNPVSDFRIGEDIYRGRIARYNDTEAPLAEAVYYRLFLQLTNGDIVAADSLTIRTLTIIDDAPPTAIANLQVTDLGDALSFRWVNPADSDLTTIEIYRQTSPINSTDGLQPMTQVSAPDDTFTDTSVVSGTEYSYAFVAVDALGGRSPDVTTTILFTDTLPPGSPRQLEAQSGSDSIKLTWIEPESEGAADYLLAWHTGHFPSLEEALSSPDSASTSDLFYLHTDPGPGVNYYSVFARDAEGNASVAAQIQSQISTATKPPSPTNFRAASGSAQDQIDLTWDDASGIADELVLLVSDIGYRYTLDDQPDGERFDINDPTVMTQTYTAASTQEYYFSLFAVRNGTASNPILDRAMPTDTIAPSGASSFEAALESIGIRLSWTLPDDPDIASIIVQWDTDAPPATPQDGLRLTELTADNSEIVQFSPAANTSYYYSLFTVDASGNTDTDASLTAQLTTPAIADIELLKNVQAIPGDGTVTLQWQALTNTDLSIYYHVSTDPDYLTDNPTATPGILPGTATGHSLSDLSNNTRVHIWLSTYDSTIPAESPALRLETTPSDTAAPAQLQDVSATGLETQVRLGWSEGDMSDVSLIKIRMSTNAAPQTSGQGSKIYDQPPGREPSFAVTNLALNERYYFSFFTLDNNGNESLPISVSAVTQDLTAPNAPSNFRLRPGDSQIDLIWDLPLNSDGVVQTKIVRSTDPIVTDADGTAVFVPSDQRFYSDADVVNEQSYYYGVYFIDASGNISLPAYADGSSDDFTAPGVAANLQAFISDSAVNLEWTLPDDADLAKTIAGYVAGGIPATAPSALTDSNDIIAPGTTTAFNSLANDQLYTFSLFTVDNVGNWENYVSISATPVSTQPAPEALNFEASAGENQISLAWTNPPSNIDATRILRSTVSVNDAISNGILISGGTFDTGTNSFVDTGLTNGIDYHYALINTNSNGDSTAVSLTSQPIDQTPPGSITGITITEQDSEIVFTWNDPTPAENDLNDIIVRRRIDDFPTDISDGSPVPGSPVAAGVQTITDTGLSNGTIYYYAFFARDNAGLISTRATIGASPVDTTAPGPVGSASVVNGNGEVTLNWVNPTNADLDRIVIRRGDNNFPPDAQSGLSVASLDNGQGSIPETFTDTGLNNFDDYFYSLFALDANNNTSVAVTLTGEPIDNDAPPTVSLTTIEELDQRIDFIWTNPTDPDFDRLRILRRDDIFPTDAFDAAATLIYEGTDTSVSDITGLINGTPYNYRFFSLDQYDNASALDIIAEPQDLTPPGSITSLTVTPSDLQVAFTWSNPGDSDIDAIIVRRRADDFPINSTDGDAVNGGDLAAGTINVTDTGLTNDTTYYYSFFVRDNAGLVSDRVTTTATPVDTNPPDPVGSASVVNGNDEVTLNWVNPTNADLDRIVIRRGDNNFPPDAQSGLSVASLDNGQGSIPETFTDTGLNNFDDYFYSLFALDANNNTSVAVTLTGEPIDNDAPPTVSLTTIEELDQRIDFIWTNPTDPDFDRLRILRRDDIFPTDAFDAAATLIYEGTDTSVSDITGLINGTPYNYRFFSLDQYDNASALDIIAEPQDLTPPGSITSLTVTPSDLQVAFTWSNPGDSDIDAIIVRRRADDFPINSTDGDAVSGADLAAGTINVTDTGLTNDTTYYYSFFVRDNAGLVSDRVTTTATPVDTNPPAAVTTLSVTGAESSVELSWTNPTDPDLDRIIIRRSDVFPAPATFDSGVSVASLDAGDGSVVPSAYTDGNVLIDQEYFYSVFAVDANNNVSTATSNSTAAIAFDATPPAVATFVSASQGEDNQVTISWTEPTEPDYTQMIICRKAGAEPIDDTDCDGRTIEPRSGTVTSNHLVSGLAAGTGYTFYLFSEDASGNLSPPLPVSGRTDYAPIPAPTFEMVMAQDSSAFFDLTYQSTGGHFNRFIVVRNDGNLEAVDPTDGTVVHSSSSDYVYPSGLTNGSSYTFKLFAIEDDYDATNDPDEWTGGEAVTLTPLPAGDIEHLNLNNLGYGDSRLPTAGMLDYGRQLITSQPQTTPEILQSDAIGFRSNYSDITAALAFTSGDRVTLNNFSSFAGIGVGTYDDTVTAEQDLFVQSMSSSGYLYGWSTYFSNSGNDEVANRIVDDNYSSIASGYVGSGTTREPALWRLSGTSLNTDFESSGQWLSSTLIPWSSTSVEFTDHIEMSDGSHLLAVRDNDFVGDQSVLRLSMTNTNVNAVTAFNADGTVWLFADDEPTVFAIADNNRENEYFPVYLMTSDAVSQVARIYSFDSDGTYGTFNSGTPLDLALAPYTEIRITSAIRYSSDLHLLATGTNGTDHDLIYWRINSSTGAVEVETVYDGTDLDGDGSADAPLDLYSHELYRDSQSGQLFFSAYGNDAGSYEIISGRIAND